MDLRLVSGGPYMVVDSGITGNRYTDAGLANGTNYYYVVMRPSVTAEELSSVRIEVQSRAEIRMLVSVPRRFYQL